MSTLFLEAFGQLAGRAVIDPQEEDLYSVFRTRAELMGWATTSNDCPLLWAMEEAELTAYNDPSCIGWVQVGLGVGPVEIIRGPSKPILGWLGLPMRQKSTDPVIALPALVQCFTDALSRFGVVELSSLQITASDLDARTGDCLGYLVSVLNWFNVNSEGRADGIVAFEQGLIGEHEISELVASLKWRNTGPFEFDRAVSVPEQHMIKLVDKRRFSVTQPSDQGVSVTMPEWTPSAAGWILASVIDAARLIKPNVSDFAVRVTRVR